MSLIDKILVVLAIFIISISIVYLVYFYSSDEMTNVLTMIIGIAGFLPGLFEFFGKK